MITQHSINKKIKVNSYLVELLDEDSEAIAKGEVSAVQRFQPEQKFVFTGEFELIDDAVDSVIPLTIGNSLKKCRFVNYEKVVPIIMLQTSCGKGFLASFILSSSPISFGESKMAQSIVFNLVNFNKEVRETEIKFNDWSLKLEIISTNNAYDELKNTGGYLVTHKAILQKNDKALFDIKESESILSFLYQLFSFCKGVPTTPFLPEGLNTDGEVIWYKIGTIRMHTWKRCNNWFSDSRIELNEFTSGFYDFCQSEHFKNHIAEIVYWYNTIYSSENNYSAVIINHTALELIS